MTESLATMMKLLDEIAGHLQANTKGDRSAARKKLERVIALSSTLALTLQGSR